MDEEIIYHEFTINFPLLAEDVAYSSRADDRSIYIRLKNGKRFKFEITDDDFGFSLTMA